MASITDKFKGLRDLAAAIEAVSRRCRSKSPANCAPALMGLQRQGELLRLTYSREY